MLDRIELESKIKQGLKRSPVVVLSGPRQTGKTTLARKFVAETSENYFDLEDPRSLLLLDEPMTALERLSGLVVIDEIQRRPELFPILRVLVDRSANNLQFLVLGSASGDLLRQSSESLAGRVTRVYIGGFHLHEVEQDAKTLWLRGGYPLSFLAHDESDSFNWRSDYIQTLLERDFPMWGVKIPSTTLFRFWSVLAHYHGQTWNAAEAGRTINVTAATANRYLDILTDAFMIRQLQPYHANIKKRQVKSPKIYFRDSGLLHRFLGIRRQKELSLHPKIGASWEGFAIEQILRTTHHDAAYFWSTHQDAEMDLVLERDGRRYGIEIKRADAPGMTKSMQIASKDLALEAVRVVYPGRKAYQLDDDVKVVPLITKDILS